jgi:uncharacterized membrane protein HdeD (DUF308 family)
MSQEAAMAETALTPAPAAAREPAAALRNYYLLRAGVAAAWVAAAFTAGAANPAVAAALLVLYPAWDATANALDARANGGLGANRAQALNLAVSGLVAVAVAIALAVASPAVLTLFGAWAILAGLLQLTAGLSRWRAYGAQWPMVLSGAQSALAGGFFIVQSLGPNPPAAITTVAPYATLGAVYFLISALALTWKLRRRA